MADPNLEKAYAKILAKREAAVARNKAEGRTLNTNPSSDIEKELTDGDKEIMERVWAEVQAKRQAAIDKNIAEGRAPGMAGVPLNDEANIRAESLGDVMDAIKNRKAAVTNISNEVKTTPADTLGLSPKVKSKFFNLDKSLGSQVAEAAENVGKAATEDTGGVLKSLKGETGAMNVLPMLGMGAAGLAAMGIGQKAVAGDYGNAALDTADLATDFIPYVGYAKMALTPTPLGASELPSEEMAERQKYNDAVKAASQKIKTPDLTKDQTQLPDYVNDTARSSAGANPSTQTPLIEPDDRAKYEDLKKQIKFNVLDKLK